MQSLITVEPGGTVPRQDSVILHFSKLEAQIVLSWSEPKAKTDFAKKV
ncbi:MAG: hypothetical protein ABIO69_03305 [Sphingomicrobium sp.]